MAKTPKSSTAVPGDHIENKAGNGGETHQRVPCDADHGDADAHLTTNHREKIFHFDHARRWRRVYKSTIEFGRRIDVLGLGRFKRSCPTVYLAGPELPPGELRAEAELHRKHGMPSTFADAEAAAAQFTITPRAALISDGGFSIERFG